MSSPPGPDWAPPGLNIPPPPGLFPPGQGKACSTAATSKPRGAESAAQTRLYPTLQRARSAKQSPQEPDTGTHQPSLGTVPARSRPCMAGELRSAPPARCPRSGTGPATSQTRLEAVTRAPMCLIFQFQSCEPFLPLPERWVNTAMAAQETT